MTDAELYTLLSGDAGIAAITSRVYNGHLPEGESLPAVTFEYVSERPVNTLAGDTGRSRRRITVNAWAADPVVARTLEVAIRAAMAAYYRVGMVPLHEPEFSVYRYAADYSILNQ